MTEDDRIAHIERDMMTLRADLAEVQRDYKLLAVEIARTTEQTAAMRNDISEIKSFVKDFPREMKNSVRWAVTAGVGGVGVIVAFASVLQDFLVT